MIKGAHKRFLVDELAILAWGASVQRAGLYDPSIRREDRGTEAFRTGVLTYLERELLPEYIAGVGESTHINNIQGLVDFGTSVGSSLLGPQGYKFGVAQKLLNLLLKYHWCLGHITEPPHCPVDRIVLDQTSLRGRLNWTEIISPDEYMRAVSAIKQVAGSLSLAQWELTHYQRR